MNPQACRSMWACALIPSLATPARLTVLGKPSADSGAHARIRTQTATTGFRACGGGARAIPGRSAVRSGYPALGPIDTELASVEVHLLPL